MKELGLPFLAGTRGVIEGFNAGVITCECQRTVGIVPHGKGKHAI